MSKNSMEGSKINNNNESCITAKDLTPARIRQIRVEVLVLTQAEFASSLGVSRSTIQKWEQGRGKVGLRNKRKLLALLEGLTNEEK